MSWIIKWCRGRNVSPNENANSEEEVIAKVRDAMRLKASNLHITKALGSREPDPEYHNICHALRQHSLIPFLGAGASFSARNEGDTQWSPDAEFPPTAAELAHWLAKACGLPAHFLSDTHNLSRVASYYVLTTYTNNPEPGAQRLDLLKKLADVFNRAKRPGPVHTFLAEHADWLPVIVTTNYDMLMEQAFIQAGKAFNKIVHLAKPQWLGSLHLQEYRWNEQEKAIALVRDEPRRLRPEELQREFGPGKPPLLYKMHGSVDSEDFVITEEDYVEFLSGIGNTSGVPPVLLRHFRQCSFLFLGYSLEDWNFRVILQNLKIKRQFSNEPVSDSEGRGGNSPPQATIGGASLLGLTAATEDSNITTEQKEPRHWAIQLGPTMVDTKVWRTRNVEIHDMDLNVFIKELADQLGAD